MESLGKVKKELISICVERKNLLEHFHGILDLTNFGCQTYVQLHFSLIPAIHFPLFSQILNNFALQKMLHNEIRIVSKEEVTRLKKMIIFI